jgi:excisionase family DNA binding protein
METNTSTSDGLDDRQWLSIDDMAVVLTVSTSTIYKWIAKGDFPAHTRLPKNKIRVHRDDLEVWMMRRRVPESLPRGM